jgi:hypothetical protein
MTLLLPSVTMTVISSIRLIVIGSNTVIELLQAPIITDLYLPALLLFFESSMVVEFPNKTFGLSGVQGNEMGVNGENTAIPRHQFANAKHAQDIF